MIVYVDTSVVLRVLLGQPNSLAEWGRWAEAWSSEIMGVEARRVIDRLRLAAAVDDQQVGEFHAQLKQVENAIGLVALNRSILRGAGRPMGTPVKTLDALHLTSAMAIHQRRNAHVSFATHDAQQAIAARALGFDCIGL